MTTNEILAGFVNDDELAVAFDKSKRTIQRWRRQGKLPSKSDPGDLTSIEAVRERLESQTSVHGEAR